MIVPIPYVHIGIGGLCSILSLPLVLHKVPMNRVYGIRIKAAFTSDHNWYAINNFGGELFFGYGLALAIFSYIFQDRYPPPNSIFAPLFLVIPLAPVIPLAVWIKRFARRLTCL